MKSYEFFWVDAFTDRVLAGNPCAVVLDADNLAPDRMQAIAREMNLSETAFVLDSSVGDFGARYFTPAEEIPLAGHPTISVGQALIEAGRLELGEGTTSFALELRDGPIQVEIGARDDGRALITMFQRRPEFLRVYSPEEVLPVFGLDPEDALPDVPIQKVSTGTPQLMVPLRSAEALRRAKLDTAAYWKLREEGDFFSPHLFRVGGFTDEGTTSARHFGVPPDTMEDPFTGSATGGMSAYLWHFGLLDGPVLVAEQGHLMNRPGQAHAEVVGTRDAIETVKVGGTAVVLVRGSLRI